MASDDERIAKYEAWIVQLESKQRAYHGRESLYHRVFAGMLAASLVGFLFNRYAGLWALGCAGLISLAGYFMVKTRHWEFAQEIAQVKTDVAQLRARATG